MVLCHNDPVNHYDYLGLETDGSEFTDVSKNVVKQYVWDGSEGMYLTLRTYGPGFHHSPIAFVGPDGKPYFIGNVYKETHKVLGLIEGRELQGQIPVRADAAVFGDFAHQLFRPNRDGSWSLGASPGMEEYTSRYSQYFDVLEPGTSEVMNRVAVIGISAPFFLMGGEGLAGLWTMGTGVSRSLAVLNGIALTDSVYMAVSGNPSIRAQLLIEAGVDPSIAKWAVFGGDLTIGIGSGVYAWTAGRMPVPRIGASNKPNLQEVPLTELRPIHGVPRPDVPPTHIEDLAQSIATNGFDQKYAIILTQIMDYEFR